MSESITITVPGLPVAQPRQRHAMIAGRMRNYVPSKHSIHDFKAAVKIAAAEAMGGKMLDGPVRVQIDCYWPCKPSRRKKELTLTKWRTSKPDADNVAKGVCDALNGVAFKDDAQVAWLTVRKCEAPHGVLSRVFIEITELDSACKCF